MMGFLYIYYNKYVLILSGFVKKVNKIPQKELNLARKKQKMIE